MWPCITKPTNSRTAQFCVMARNRWSGSAWVNFWFWYILKEQSFFYIILKFGSIKHIISRVFCCFSRPMFLWSDGSCDHSTCPIISLWTWLSCLLWTLISFERSKLEHWNLRVVMNRMYSISVATFRIIWISHHNNFYRVLDPVFVPTHYTMVFCIDALALMRLNRSLLL